MLVGIADYAHADLAAMPAADAGAGHLAQLLRDPSLWGLPQEHVAVLGPGATQARILAAVRDAALATEDTLVVYFAGHGLRDPGERLHLALADADPDYPQIGTLPYRQLRDLIRYAGHRAKHRVTVLDCCYSGIAGGMSGTGAPTRDDLATALDEHTQNPTDGDEDRHGPGSDGYGDCVLASAPAQSRSFVRPGAPFPEFTGELITTLEAGITGVGPAVSLEHVWLRLHDRMRRRGSPEPQLFAQNNATRHIHFHNRAPHQHSEQSTTAPHTAPGPASSRPARTTDDRLEDFTTGSSSALRRTANASEPVPEATAQRPEASTPPSPGGPTPKKATVTKTRIAIAIWFLITLMAITLTAINYDGNDDDRDTASSATAVTTANVALVIWFATQALRKTKSAVTRNWIAIAIWFLITLMAATLTAVNNNGHGDDYDLVIGAGVVSTATVGLIVWFATQARRRPRP
ncbi:hypothetical protein [Streptomyces sp. NPDC004134]|uniref:caspase, EACC1-associated type n=1 Tax=Streptomyces sp. NPDC004134 TaxID=3364691 RepID=UPI0036BA632C